MGVSAVRESIVRCAGAKADPARASETPAIVASFRGWMRCLIFGFGVSLLGSDMAAGSVLSEADFKKVETIKPLFQNLMGDLVQASKRPDISSGDAECINSTVRELLQISEELSSYEYLITIEREMTDFGENSPVKGVIIFAIEKSNVILSVEKRRLNQLFERCARFPVAPGKVEQAVQFIDITTDLLVSIQSRL